MVFLLGDVLVVLALLRQASIAESRGLFCNGLQVVANLRICVCFHGFRLLKLVPHQAFHWPLKSPNQLPVRMDSHQQKCFLAFATKRPPI